MSSRSLMCLSVRLLVATTILLWGYGALHAQSIQYGKINGKVLDEGVEPIPGVQVEISSEALITGTRSTTSSENGTYVFLNLPTGMYRVSASLAGFKTAVRENIQISAGAVATVNFSMQLGAVEESITVTESAPIVDRTTSTVEAKIDEELITRLPTSRDSFYDLSLLSPGMFDVGRDSASLPSPTAYGSGTDANAFLVNGVNATDPRGGSFGSLVNVNYDTVEEVRIISLGAKAEYGSSTGVAIDVTTKSGGNRFHGQASVYSQLGKPADNAPTVGDNLGRDWLTLDPTIKLSGTIEKDREFSFTFGGPVIKDRIWFYTAVNALAENDKSPLWPVLLENKDRYYDFKVSAEPMKNHQAWLSYHFERNQNSGSTWGENVPWDATLQYGAKTKNDTISSQWQWVPSAKSIFTAKYLGFWTGWDPFLPQNAPANSGYINWWKWQEFGVNGHFPYIEAHDASRHTVQADMTQYVEDFLGQQDIKFGVQYTTGHGNDTGGYFAGYANFAYPYRWTQDITYTKEEYGDTGMLWYVNQYHLPPFVTAREFKQTGAFMDDQWTLSQRLTLNLGIRFDHSTDRYAEGKVLELPANITDDVSNLKVVRNRQGTGNIFDFDNWSPRIGAAYSITEDGKTVFRTNYGRYYAPVGLENLRRLGPDMPINELHVFQYSVPWDQVDLNHNNFIDPQEVTNAARLLRGLTPLSEEVSQRDDSWRLNVNPGTKNQYLDQWTVNVEREIAPDLSVSGTFIYRNTKNILVNVPINNQTGEPWDYIRVPFTTDVEVNGQHYSQDVSLYSIVIKDYTGDGKIDGDDVRFVSDNNGYEVRNLGTLDGVDPERVYKGLQFVVTKRFSKRAQMLASFLYSDSHGPANRNNFQDQNTEGPMIYDTGFFESLNDSINNLTGPLPFTPKYEFKLSGSYFLPKLDADFGLRLRYNSGRPTWFIQETNQITPDNFEDPPPGAVLEPGTPGIVAVAPDTPFYLPAATLLDLRFAKALNFGAGQRTLFSLDVFNVFNSNVITNTNFTGVPGQATALVNGRKFRLGVSYQF
jgi:hypothetical protein